MNQKIILINPEDASEQEVSSWRERHAARGVVTDSEGRVALLSVERDGYYKLPGGGINEGEEKVAAFKRECLEEIGCDVEVVLELGVVEEWRKIYELRQFSYCYVGKVIGEKGEPNLEPDEAEKGFKVIWVGLEEALRLLENSKTDSPEGDMYIRTRDVAIVKKFLESKK